MPFPVFAVYSTFLQRAYDMLLHDAAIDNLDGQVKAFQAQQQQEKIEHIRAYFSWLPAPSPGSGPDQFLARI